ncbi:MAG: aminoacyl-histidine dipeptidase [Bacteroidales bacterium]
MIMEISNLQPRALWENFSAICNIPHPSGHIDQIRQFLVDFGNSLSLETLTDEVGNVLIRKPATPGMENAPIVVLQAHMDMVPQKNSNVDHDFEKDPIQAYVDGEWVKAKDTTLGADNGIGMAAIMAVLQSKEIKHGPIEALITADEETGMFGAFGLKEGFVKGKILMNTDSEDWGELFVGCAGGVDVTASIQYKEENEIPEGDIALKISVTGLKGGHSGCDIHLGRANANKLLFRFLKPAVALHEARLSWVKGGSLRNAIPREAFAIVTIPAEAKDEFMEMADEYQADIRDDYKGVEDGIKFEVEEVALPKTLIPEEIQDNIINAVVAVPNGAARFLVDMPDVVETSSNMAIISADKGIFSVKFLVRGSNDNLKMDLASSIESTFALAGAKVEFSGEYPGWNPNMDSQILHVMKDEYKKLYGVEPKVNVIHAGLECGIIGAACPGMDMISYGPTVRFPHSPDEKVNIKDVELFWDYTKAILENIK